RSAVSCSVFFSSRSRHTSSTRDWSSDVCSSDLGYRYDLQALDAAFADGGGLLVLCNPHNPIGRVLSTAEMAEISDVVARHDARVFADEIHAPLVYSPARHVPYASISAQAARQAITATS